MLLALWSTLGNESGSAAITTGNPIGLLLSLTYTTEAEAPPLITGNMAVIDPPDHFAAAGHVASIGTMAAVEAHDSAAIGLSILDTLAATEASDTAAFVVHSVAVGNMAATEAPDRAAMRSSSVGDIGRTATVTVTLPTSSVTVTL